MDGREYYGIWSDECEPRIHDLVKNGGRERKPKTSKYTQGQSRLVGLPITSVVFSMAHVNVREES